MLGQQQVGGHHQQQHAARGAEGGQADADQFQQLNPAQCERQQHGQRRGGGEDGELAPVRRIHARRQSQEHGRHLHRPDGDEQRGQGAGEQVEHESGLARTVQKSPKGLPPGFGFAPLRAPSGDGRGDDRDRGGDNCDDGGGDRRAASYNSGHCDGGGNDSTRRGASGANGDYDRNTHRYKRRRYFRNRT